jgi:hypothetical protein
MSEQIQEGPGPKPKKRKKIKKIKISSGPFNDGSDDLNKRVYFSCEPEEINSGDVALIKSISVVNTAITNAQVFNFDTSVSITDFYMLDDDEGHIRASIVALISDGKDSAELTITYNDEPETPETYSVGLEM